MIGFDGLPPHWQTWLDHPALTDFVINGPEPIQAFADLGKGLFEVPLEGPELGSVTGEILLQWINRVLASVGKSWDARHPYVDLHLHRDANRWRIHALLPPLTLGFPLISIRKLSTPERGSAEERWAGFKGFSFLRDRVAAGESLLISGATGAGKTTLMNDLIGAIPPRERIIALEDTPELAPLHPHFLSLQSRTANADGYGEIGLRVLLKQCLRMRPDRILVGECRGGEVLDLLLALNTGHQGSLATLHANSPKEALKRIELLCLLYGPSQLSPSLVRDLLSTSIRWVIQLRREGPQRERRFELFRIEGREGDTLLMRPMIDFQS